MRGQHAGADGPPRLVRGTTGRVHIDNSKLSRKADRAYAEAAIHDAARPAWD